MRLRSVGLVIPVSVDWILAFCEVYGLRELTILQTTGKPKLAAVKSLGNKADTDVYDDVLDDGDFM